jgi:hypothetical protein
MQTLHANELEHAKQVRLQRVAWPRGARCRGRWQDPCRRSRPLAATPNPHRPKPVGRIARRCIARRCIARPLGTRTCVLRAVRRDALQRPAHRGRTQRFEDMKRPDVGASGLAPRDRRGVGRRRDCHSRSRGPFLRSPSGSPGGLFSAASSSAVSPPLVPAPNQSPPWSHGRRQAPTRL